MDIGEQERVIIVEPLQAPTAPDPDLPPIEPEPVEEPAAFRYPNPVELETMR